jgi:hypothetical protein
MFRKSMVIVIKLFVRGARDSAKSGRAASIARMAAFLAVPFSFVTFLLGKQKKSKSRGTNDHVRSNSWTGVTSRLEIGNSPTDSELAYFLEHKLTAKNTQNFTGFWHHPGL